MVVNPADSAARALSTLLATHVFLPAPYCATGGNIDSVYLIATMLSRDGIVVVKFTKSRTMPRHFF